MIRSLGTFTTPSVFLTPSRRIIDLFPNSVPTPIPTPIPTPEVVVILGVEVVKVGEEGGFRVKTEEGFQIYVTNIMREVVLFRNVNSLIFVLSVVEYILLPIVKMVLLQSLKHLPLTRKINDFVVLMSLPGVSTSWEWMLVLFLIM